MWDPETLVPKEKQQKRLYNDLPFYTVRILRSLHTLSKDTTVSQLKRSGVGK